jgi:uncharacterized protein
MKSSRIAGLDLANALALPGLFLTSYVLGLTNVFTKTLVIQHDIIRDVWACLCLFVSGMLVTITMHGARKRSRTKKKFFVRKGVVFIIIGLLISLIWPVNLFIIMGILFATAPYLALLNSNILKSLMFLVFISSVCLSQFGEINLSPTLLSVKLLSPSTIINYISNIGITGYYALIPWSGFFLAGMIFSRNDIMQKRTFRFNNLGGLIGLILGIVVHEMWADINPPVHLSTATTSLPYKLILIVETPAFVILGTSMCVLIVNQLIHIGSKFRNNGIIKTIAQIGSMKQSLYLAHLIIGCVLVIGLNSNIFNSYRLVLVVFGGVTIILFALSILWNKRYKLGPVEWAIQRLSSKHEKY